MINWKQNKLFCKFWKQRTKYTKKLKRQITKNKKSRKLHENK